MTKTPFLLERLPDFRGRGSFRTERGFVESLECAFFLPASETAKAWVLVRSRGVIPLLLDWKFSCELAVGTEVLVAGEVFHSGYVPRDWGEGVEQSLVGDITRLTVSRGDAEGSRIVRARFVITPSALLRSADFLTEREGETVSRQVARPGPVCRVTPGMAFRFASAYRRDRAGKVESNVECELIEPTAMGDSKDVLSSLEDVLTLASLAERRVLLLTGWLVEYANGAIVTCYRRDFTASSNEESDVDQALISLESIAEFLNATMAKLARLPHPGALKQAIYFALHGQGRGIGDSFVMLFAGVETLLNLFLADENLEPIIPQKQWEPLFERMSTALTGEKDFQALSPDTQSQLLGNVRGANRAFFADRFARMCISQKIDLDDLWPMLGGQASLYGVRNRIAHGRVFSSDKEWFRIISAKYHLLWTLERSILSILGWPIERSRVSPRALSGLTLYSSWRTDRDSILGAK